MRYERTIRIEAPAERVWATMSDVERWPGWTASVTRADRLDPGPFAVGSRFRVLQPRLRPAVWTVTAVEPGRSFTWETASPGLRIVGVHAIADDGGAVVASLELAMSGLLAPLLWWLTRGLTERYVTLEAEGLKRASEGG